MTRGDQQLLILTLVLAPVALALAASLARRGTLAWLWAWVKWRTARPRFNSSPVWREERFQWALRRPRLHGRRTK